MIVVDPERHEVDALFALAGDLTGLHVLEVGCGDGRLTRRYAGQAGRVLAIDPKADAIADARRGFGSNFGASVEFRHTGIETLDAREAPFDLIIMAWSL